MQCFAGSTEALEELKTSMRWAAVNSAKAAWPSETFVVYPIPSSPS